MNRTIKTVLIGLLFFSIYFGASQLGSNNDVFAGAMARCCNNGMCHGGPCATTSSVLPCFGSEYITTCLGCMNTIVFLQNCDRYLGPWPTWCILSDGTKYYADLLLE